MNLDWVDQQLKARGLPRRALAEVIPGMTEVKLSLIWSGKRRLTSDEADAIRRFFGYRLPDDPPTTWEHELHDVMSRLREDQRRAVILYLEALTGGDC